MLCPSLTKTWISNVFFVVFLVFDVFRWEVIVCFVDMGGIDDYHCLTFFIISMGLINVVCYFGKTYVNNIPR